WVRITPRPPVVWPNSVNFDPRNSDTIYVIATEFGIGEGRLQMYKTTDAGVSWVSRTAGGLPSFILSQLRVDPFHNRSLYCGSLFGLYRSTDDGESWFKFGHGLPNTWVSDVRFFDDGVTIRVATFGRGIWETRLKEDNRPLITAVSGDGKKLIIKGRYFDEG